MYKLKFVLLLIFIFIVNLYLQFDLNSTEELTTIKLWINIFILAGSIPFFYKKEDFKYVIEKTFEWICMFKYVNYKLIITDNINSIIITPFVCYSVIFDILLNKDEASNKIKIEIMNRVL